MLYKPNNENKCRIYKECLRFVEKRELKLYYLLKRRKSAANMPRSTLSFM